MKMPDQRPFTSTMATLSRPLYKIVWVYLFLLMRSHVSGQLESKLTYTVDEESGVNVFIGNTGRDSGLLDKYTNEFKNLLFRPFEKGNENVKFFSVDQDTGVIRTALNIDREAICQKSMTCLIGVDIGVFNKSSNNNLLALVQVSVLINDINDNSPTFPAKVVDLKVAENNEVDKTLYTSVASDSDAEGDNSRITYKFETPSDMFELSTVRTIDGLEDLVITIKKRLDREIKSLYSLTVVATDLGRPSRNGTVLINIVVTDVNDNAPVFGQSSYAVNILENYDRNLPVVIVSASDQDEGENGRLTYSLGSQVSAEIQNTFVVEANSGKVFARQQLDYETRSKYQFFVSVADNGSPPKFSIAEVTVNVLDVNDNSPVISVNIGPGGDTIEEEGSEGKYVGIVTVKDADVCSQGKISCEIEDSHFSLSSINPDMGLYQIKLSRKLDREQSSKVNVVVVCQDGDDLMPLTSSATITVTVLDINDNSPVFRDSSLYGSVMENEDAHTSVMQVEAADIDEGENCRVTYSLTGGENPSMFSIDPNSGVISTLQSLDREVKQEYRLEVTATDNGQPVLSRTASVTIKVLDENDNPPKFKKQAYFNSILENLPPGSPAGDVPAYDPDSSENGRFLFTILNGAGSEDGIFFSIDPDTGLIKSEKKFDRESKKTYTFRVRVADPRIPNFNDVANVTITVVDDNDHAPVVIQPPPESRNFYCAFNLTVGFVITTIISSDEDDPKLVEISYDIIEQLTKKQSVPLFSIDQYTGKLRVARQITPDDVGTHLLVILVKDGADTKAKNSTVNLTIIVEPGSEEAMRAFNVDNSKTNNMIIVIIIVAATIVVAIIIVAIICLLRRNDKKRGPPPSNQNSAEANNKMYQAAKWVSSVSIHNDLAPDEMKNTLEVPGEKKKKKEVSFSLDDEVVEPHDTTGSIASMYSNTQKVMPREEGVSYHPEEHQFMEVNRQAEDRYSDASSGDTGTSDSGRGGSEDESHGHSTSSGVEDIRKIKFVPSPTAGSSTANHVRFQQPQVVSDNEEIPGSPTPMLSEADRIQSHHCYIRRSFDKLPAHGLGYPSGTSTRSTPSPTQNVGGSNYNSQPRHSTARLDNSDNSFRTKTPDGQPQVLQTFSSPYATGLPTSSSHPAWRRAKGLDTSWRSNTSSPVRHDDDDNTTTSGSYIINPDDLKEDTYNADIMV
ncbi:protocadherin alpha-1-like isoform X2 [Biomphalaria glabrata]|uniref:Protocadherin alpha-1-like isoform X2 n=1 Tax=Biomphalaria glabrata TaxID=6526 RepID=A0A9W3B449_BIOGL|nr:protocadherin alpha-1-like isoform X2 [Biomphalaria glabrata]